MIGESFAPGGLNRRADEWVYRTAGGGGWRNWLCKGEVTLWGFPAAGSVAMVHFNVWICAGFLYNEY